MGFKLELTGDIEIKCLTAPIYKDDRARLVFKLLEHSEPPFTLKVKSPSSKIVVDRVLRELPTGRPQSAEPIEFIASEEGSYKIIIKELYPENPQKPILGEATMKIEEKKP